MDICASNWSWSPNVLQPTRKDSARPQPVFFPQERLARHNIDHYSLTQSPWIRAPGPTKLQPRPIANLHDPIAQIPPLVPQQRLRDRLATRPEPAKHELEPIDRFHGAAIVVAAAPQQATLLHRAHDVGRELEGGVVRAALGLAEAQVAGRQREQGVAVRPRQRQVRVVLGREDVQVVRFVGQGGGHQRARRWWSACRRCRPWAGPLRPYHVL